MVADVTAVYDVDRDFERRLISCLLLDPAQVEAVEAIVSPNDFQDLGSQIIIHVLHEKRGELATPEGVIDVLLLARELEARGELDSIGGRPGLADVLDLEAVGSYAETYARQVKRASLVREIQQYLRELNNRPDDPDAYEYLAERVSELRRLDLEIDGIGDRSTDFRRYTLENFAEIEPESSSGDLVKGLLSRGSLVVLYGAPGSTKSFVALELGLAVASGQLWRDRRTKRGRVVYIAAEGALGMKRRIKAARARYALGPAERVQFQLLADVVSLDPESGDVREFIRAMRASGGEGVALVIIDTLAQSMTGDENTSRDMMAVVKAAREIQAELGAAVLIVHHSGKDVSRGARGSISLKGAADTEIEVSQSGGGLCTVRTTKQKEGITGEEWMHRLEVVELGTDEDGDPITTAIVKPLGADQAATEIAEASGSPKIGEREASIVRAMLDAQSINGRLPVPADVIQASGYAQALREMGKDPKEITYGARRSQAVALASERFADAIPGDTSDGNATEKKKEEKRRKDRVRANVKRRIDSAIHKSVIWGHGDWLWLPCDGPRR